MRAKGKESGVAGVQELQNGIGGSLQFGDGIFLPTAVDITSLHKVSFPSPVTPNTPELL